MDNKIYQKIYIWLFVGLLITFGTGYFLSLNENLASQILTIGILPIIVIELVVALLMGIRIKKMHPLTAKLFYLIYSVTTGITFSMLFLYYNLSSMMFIFLISAIIFIVLAIFGATTKRDLSKFGMILLTSLFVIIIVSLLNALIFKSPITDIVISGICVLIFCGFIAYDMQKIKVMQYIVSEEKAAIFGAFQLYLDFINLFIHLLELFGKSKDN